MKIGISYWGFLEKFEDCAEPNTPDGHRYGRPILADELMRRGHEVVSLQKMREKNPYPGVVYDDSGYPDIDVLLVEWRWPTYKNSGENPQEPDLMRQNELLEEYHGSIPVVIWDCDHKVTEQDEKKWKNAIFADPSLRPKQMHADRVRLMFWTDWKPLIQTSQHGFEYGYIGNNYERDDQFEKYYGNPSSMLREMGIQTTVHGNWLQRSPERADPSTLIEKHRYISFGQRLGFKDSMQRLSGFIATTHISKPDYSVRGFVSPRFLENIATGTPALVPSELLHKDYLGKQWVVNDADDVKKKVFYISTLTQHGREELVKEQADVLKSKGLFSVTDAVDYLTSLE
jgi:hypothetical protein